MTAGARNPPRCQLSRLTCERVYSNKQLPFFPITFPNSQTRTYGLSKPNALCNDVYSVPHLRADPAAMERIRVSKVAPHGLRIRGLHTDDSR
jgi:hypothetical protein